MRISLHSFWGEFSIYRVHNNYHTICKGPVHDGPATYTLSVNQNEWGKVYFTKREGPENYYGAWLEYKEDCYEEVEVEFLENGSHSITLESKEDDVGQVAFGAVALYSAEPMSPQLERIEAEQVRAEDITGTFTLQRTNRRTIHHRNLNAPEPDRIGSSVTFRFKTWQKGRYRIRIYYYSKKQNGLYEILYLVKGCGQYTVNQQVLELTPGCMVLTRHDENRKLSLSPDIDNEYITIEFRFDFLQSYDKELRLLRPFVARIGDDKCLYTHTEIAESLKQQFREIGIKKYDDVYLRKIQMKIRVQQILFDIYSNYLSVNAPAKKETVGIMDLAVELIQESLFENISADFISQKLFTSKSNLDYLFRKQYGCSVHAYIMQQRLLAARSKMQNGMAPSEVCYLCGFKDYSTFYRQYKKQFGISPKEERIAYTSFLDLMQS